MGPERDGVAGEPGVAKGNGDGRGEPPRGVLGVLGDGLVSRIRGDGFAMLQRSGAIRYSSRQQCKEQEHKMSARASSLLPQAFL